MGRCFRTRKSLYSLRHLQRRILRDDHTRQKSGPWNGLTGWALSVGPFHDHQTDLARLEIAAKVIDASSKELNRTLDVHHLKCSILRLSAFDSKVDRLQTQHILDMIFRFGPWMFSLSLLESTSLVPRRNGGHVTYDKWEPHKNSPDVSCSKYWYRAFSISRLMGPVTVFNTPRHDFKTPVIFAPFTDHELSAIKFDCIP